MIIVPLCQRHSPKYIITMLKFKANQINIECEEYVNWIIENGVNGHIYNDVEARFENEEDAVAFKLRFEL
jgi:mannitol-1-phosphate/altronate dehydrogenase